MFGGGKAVVRFWFVGGLFVLGVWGGGGGGGGLALKKYELLRREERDSEHVRMTSTLLSKFKPSF